MTRRTFTVMVGSLELTASADVVGKFRPAVTQADPYYCCEAEAPEIDVMRLSVGATDLSGLLDDEDILESVHAQILGKLADEQFNGDQS